MCEDESGGRELRGADSGGSVRSGELGLIEAEG